MDFQNLNPLNSRANILSGNLLPMENRDDLRLSIGRRVYCAIILLIEVVHITAFISGVVLLPRKNAMLNGTINAAIFIEVMIMLVHFHTQKQLLKRIIGKLNDLLRDADETMKDIVKSTMKPSTKLFALYGIVSVMWVLAWTIHPILLVFERDTFFYSDYNFPTAFCAEPFSSSVFISTTLIMAIGCVLRFIKKYSMEVYMMYLVLLLTAQYRYTATKLVQLFRHSREIKERRLKADRWVETELRTLCQHYNTVMCISFMLKKLLSLNFGIIYLNSVFRFCFLGILMTTLSSSTFVRSISILLFGCSSVTHFFLVCSSVQSLLDTSAEITEKAFHECWYQLRVSTKQRIYLFFSMANNLECKLSTIDKFDLSLRSFITIINQSYSIALFFLQCPYKE